MIFFPTNENPSQVKIVSQGVDTLVTTHSSINEDDYNNIYLPFLRYLEEIKDKAQEVRSLNQQARYCKADLHGLGHFKVYAQSKGSYSYTIENNDFLIFLGTHKYGANDFLTPQIKVEVRSHCLFALSYKKTYHLILKLVKKMIGQTNNMLNRIDLYTDVQGVKYSNFDEVRFQTNYKNVDFSVRKFSKFKKVTGFHYGNGDFLFRIYDKVNESKNRPHKAFIKYKWIINGYNIYEPIPVWRHEVQYRRPELKKFIPRVTDDEILYHFSQLDKLWNNAISKVRWAPLTNDEIFRVSENNLKSDSIKRIFQRSREKQNRFHFWNILDNWDNKLTQQVTTYKYIKEPQDKTAKKLLKAFIGSTYKARSNDPLEAISVFEEVEREIRDQMGLTLHEYGELKVVSSFVENARTILSDGLVVDYDYSREAFKIYSELCRKIKNIDKHPDMKRAYKIFQSADKKTQNKLSKLEIELYDRIQSVKVS